MASFGFKYGGYNGYIIVMAINGISWDMISAINYFIWYLYICWVYPRTARNYTDWLPHCQRTYLTKSKQTRKTDIFTVSKHGSFVNKSGNWTNRCWCFGLGWTWNHYTETKICWNDVSDVSYCPLVNPDIGHLLSEDVSCVWSRLEGAFLTFQLFCFFGN